MAVISEIKKIPEKQNILFLANDKGSIPNGFLSKAELGWITSLRKKSKKDFFTFNRLDHHLFIRFMKEEQNTFKRLENCRKAGDDLGSVLEDQKIDDIILTDIKTGPGELFAFAEGLVLGSYRFLKYKTEKEKRVDLKKIRIFSKNVSSTDIAHLSIMAEAVFLCRTLINEPNSFLTAPVFSREVEKMAKECGAKIEVLNKKKIEALQMGGLLGVNKGSTEPPTFTIMEWKPLQKVNKKPYVFVGKGVVFDSGGMNLKPGDSMSTMKDDMSGAAAVAAAVYAIAKAKLPVWIIGLMPATDNRPGEKAVVPGDILIMHNKMTVEVLNTDAEGRLILADALAYAKKYDPELVIDLATLTGSAVRAVGKYGIVAMQSKAEKELELLKTSGWEVYERLVEFPSWDEYGELMKSDVADLKNVGPGEGGAITAGKFLEKFTDFPFIHLDIAGPAFLEKPDSYRGKGGTGVGVRLLFNFIKNKTHKKS
jgi:leucyl aminopeptidase